MTRFNLITEPTFNQLPIQACPKRGLECRDDILFDLQQQMTTALQQGRTMFIRFDLRFPNGFQTAPSDNKRLQKFFNSFKKFLSDQGLRPQNLWVREQVGEISQHYHCVLLTKATDSVPKQFKDYRYILKLAEEYWNLALGLNRYVNYGLVEYCDKNPDGSFHNRNGAILYQNTIDGGLFRECYKWASYLAKANTKQVGHGNRNWGSSQLPKLGESESYL